MDSDCAEQGRLEVYDRGLCLAVDITALMMIVL